MQLDDHEPGGVQVEGVIGLPALKSCFKKAQTKGQRDSRRLTFSNPFAENMSQSRFGNQMFQSARKSEQVLSPGLFPLGSVHTHAFSDIESLDEDEFRPRSDVRRVYSSDTQSNVAEQVSQHHRIVTYGSDVVEQHVQHHRSGSNRGREECAARPRCHYLTQDPYLRTGSL